jgi:hypothetical protein
MATDAPAWGQERPGNVPWVVPVALALPRIGCGWHLPTDLAT